MATTSAPLTAALTTSRATGPVSDKPAAGTSARPATASTRATLPELRDATIPQPKTTKTKNDVVASAARAADHVAGLVDRGAAARPGAQGLPGSQGLRGPQMLPDRAAQPARERATALTAALTSEGSARQTHDGVQSTSRALRATAPATWAGAITSTGAPSTATVIEATPESAPLDDQAPSFSLSAAVSGGGASASGSSSLLLFAGVVDDAASSHHASRLEPVVHDDDRLPVGPAAATDCPPD